MAMQKEVMVALIAAGASIVVAVFSAIFSLLTAHRAAKVGIDLERFKGRLGEQAAERDARRDYEYDARKRLYAEVEPLLFQLYESLEEAHYRVRSLARTSRSGNLGEGDASWVDGPGYYLKSTMYKLILPAVHFRLMQRRVTFVDLNLDESIRLRYHLMKLYSRSFTDDFILAAIAPKLRYDPNNEPSRTARETEPAVYLRQGLVLGDLENVAEALLIQQVDKPARAMAFSDFDQLVKTKLSSNESVNELIALLTGFSPKTRPVLARILVAQACMAQLILSTFDQKTKTAQLEGRFNEIVSAIEKSNTLAWTGEKPCEDLQVARQYWSERLKWVGATTWIERDKSA